MSLDTIFISNWPKFQSFFSNLVDWFAVLFVANYSYQCCFTKQLMVFGEVNQSDFLINMMSFAFQKRQNQYQQFKFHQMNKVSIVTMLQKAENIKINLPRVDNEVLHNQLGYIRWRINQSTSSILICGCISMQPKNISPFFKRAINSMDKQEMAQFYLMAWTAIERYYQNGQKEHPHTPRRRHEHATSHASIHELVQERFQGIVKQTILIKQGAVFPTWQERKIIIDKKEKSLSVQNLYKLDLHKYIIRQSKNPSTSSFVLQSLQNNEENQSVRMSTIQRKDYVDFYSLIKKIIREAHKQNINLILANSGFNARASLKTNRSGRGSVFAVKQINHHTEVRENIHQNNSHRQGQATENQPRLKRSLSKSSRGDKTERSERQNYNQNKIKIIDKNLNKFEAYKKITSQVYYEIKGKKIRKQYLIPREKTSSQQLAFQLENFNQFFKWKPNLRSVDLLQKSLKGKSHIFHEVHHYPNDMQIQYLYSRKYICMSGAHYFFDKQIREGLVVKPKTLRRGLINSVIWRIKNKDKDNIEVIVQADINHAATVNQKDFSNYFIGDFDKSKQNLRKHDEDHQSIYRESQFMGGLSQIGHQDIQLSFYSISDDSQQTEKIGRKQVHFDKQEEQLDQSIQEINLYNCQHVVNPKKDYKRRLQSNQNGHFMYAGEWEVVKSGDVVNINKQKIERQNNAVALVLKRLGMNIIRGKNIMHVSLPVHLCNQKSFVQSLCHSLAYAPIVLQKVAKSNPIEKFKGVFLILVSIMFLHLQIDKPFNPILGETYQAMIDGCPVYGEQISHHPPVSRIFMKGRGYTIYGYREPKIEVGFNSVTAVSEGDINVSFNQKDITKDVITFGCIHGQVKNVIFGEKAIRAVKNTPFIDRTNNLYCNLHWGKGSNPSGEFKGLHNSLYGRLVQVNPDFNFQKQPKQEDIVRQIGIFNGTWLDKVYFQKEVIMDFNTMCPCVVEDYEPCLQSDSRKRKDIIFRRRQEWDESQEAKQELQDLQRCDRKLRDNFKLVKNSY